MPSGFAGKPDDRVIGYRDFVDGIRRPIFEDRNGRQYVVNEDGQIVHGVFLIPEDEPDLPIIVDSRGQ